MNCGQGLENGWSTDTDSPLVYAERMLSTANSVGLRTGDDYDWSYNGYLNVTNSLILCNYRDVFLNAKSPRSKVAKRPSRQPNIQHPTSNIQHPRSKAQ